MNRLFTVLTLLCLSFSTTQVNSQTFQNFYNTAVNGMCGTILPNYNDDFGGGFTFRSAYILQSHIEAYRTTKSISHLQRFVAHSRYIIDHRDDNVSPQRADYSGAVRPVWVSDLAHNDNPNQYLYAQTVSTGNILFGMADFVHLVKVEHATGSPNLESFPIIPSLTNEWCGEPVASGFFDNYGSPITTLGEYADWLMEEIHISLEAHNNSDEWVETSFFSLQYGYYRHKGSVVSGASGAVFGGHTVPGANHQNAMGMTYARMYAVYNSLLGSSDPMTQEYFDKSWRIGIYWYSQLNHDGQPYKWKYNAGGFGVTGGDEDISHASISVNFAKVMYEAGIIFDADDMQLFARMITERIYRDPDFLYMAVDGTDNITGSGPSTRFNASEQIGMYAWFTQWDRDIFHLCSDRYLDRALAPTINPSIMGDSRLLSFAKIAAAEHNLNPIAVNRDPGPANDFKGACLGDFDNDGIDEVVIASNFNGNIYMYELDGSEISSIASNSTPGSGIQWAGGAAGDFDPQHPGDEFVLFSNYQGDFYMYELNGSNIQFKVSNNTPGSAIDWVDVAAGDFDPTHPGDEFVALSNFQGSIFMYEYNKVGAVESLDWVASNHDYTAAIDWAALDAGNFDLSDNEAEFMAVANQTGNIMMFDYTTTGGIQLVAQNTSPGLNSNWQAAAAGDFDGDGTEEIGFSRTYDGNMYFYSFDGSNIVFEVSEYFKYNWEPHVMAGGAMTQVNQSWDQLFVIRGFDENLYVYEFVDVDKGLVPQGPCDASAIITGGGDVVHSNEDVISNENWSNETHVVSGTLTVKSGSKLQVSNGEVIFAEDAKIIIEEGAEVTFNHSRLGGCKSVAGYWDGIEIRGNANKIQKKQFQGKLTLNHSHISDARIAVYAGERNPYSGARVPSGAGGIVSIKSGNTFTNNKLCIFIDKYGKEQKASHIKGSIFENSSVADGDREHIVCEGTKGLVIEDNYFYDGKTAIRMEESEDFAIATNTFASMETAIATKESEAGDASYIEDNDFVSTRIAVTMEDDNHSNLVLGCNKFEDFADYAIKAENTTLGDQGTNSKGAGNTFQTNSQQQFCYVNHTGPQLTYHFDPAQASDFANPDVVSTNRAQANNNAQCTPGVKSLTHSTTQQPVAVSLYPNPNNGRFTLQYELAVNGDLIIVDMTGKAVYSTALDAGSKALHLDLPMLENGVYLYTVSSAGRVLVQDKLVILE